MKGSAENQESKNSSELWRVLPWLAPRHPTYTQLRTLGFGHTSSRRAFKRTLDLDEATEFAMRYSSDTALPLTPEEMRFEAHLIANGYLPRIARLAARRGDDLAEAIQWARYYTHRAHGGRNDAMFLPGKGACGECDECKKIRYARLREAGVRVLERKYVAAGGRLDRGGGGAYCIGGGGIDGGGGGAC